MSKTCMLEMNSWSAQAVLALLLPKAMLWARAKYGFARRRRERGSRTPNRRGTNPEQKLTKLS